VKHLARIQAAVSIHHGALDGTVPPEWSSDLFGWLQGLGKPAEYFDYPDQPHTFKGAGTSSSSSGARVFRSGAEGKR